MYEYAKPAFLHCQSKSITVKIQKKKKWLIYRKTATAMKHTVPLDAYGGDEDYEISRDCDLTHLLSQG